jgi:hypothetical protein
MGSRLVVLVDEVIFFSSFPVTVGKCDSHGKSPSISFRTEFHFEVRTMLLKRELQQDALLHSWTRMGFIVGTDGGVDWKN